MTWKRVPYDQVVFGPGTRIGAMAAGGPGLVAIGEDGGKAVVWTATYG